MSQTTLTLGHSPDPDDAFMFYGLARELIPAHGFRFQHILQDIQTLNERATRGELDITAISIHAYAYVSDQYALLPSGASMGDGYGPMLVAKEKLSRAEVAGKKIAVREQEYLFSLLAEGNLQDFVKSRHAVDREAVHCVVRFLLVLVSG